MWPRLPVTRIFEGCTIQYTGDTSARVPAGWSCSFVVVYTKIDRFPMNSGVFVCCVAGKPRSMSHQDNQLNRLESLRQRFGFCVDAFVCGRS